VTITQRLNLFSSTGRGDAAQTTFFVYPAETQRHSSANPANPTSSSLPPERVHLEAETTLAAGQGTRTSSANCPESLATLLN